MDIEPEELKTPVIYKFEYGHCCTDMRSSKIIQITMTNSFY
jgi:hypothetical protein